VFTRYHTQLFSETFFTLKIGIHVVYEDLEYRHPSLKSVCW